MPRFAFHPLASTLLLALVGLAGCSRDPDALKRRFTARGDAYAARKQYAEATIEYRKALQQDPRFAEAYLKLAEAYAADGDARDALPAYVRAADLSPENTDANLKAGNLLLVARHFQDAKTRARVVLERHPDNVPALILMGNALAGLGSLDDAVAVAERAAALNPRRAGLYGNLGVLQLARGNTAQAEAAFTRAVTIDPRSTQALLGLSNFYLTTGRLREAEVTLLRLHAIDTRSVEANQALANLYLQSGRARDAETFLKTVADVQQNAEAWLALADYYLGTGRVDESRRLLDRVSSTAEGYAVGRIRTALIAAASGRAPDAHAALREVLAREPKNGPAMALEARLLLSENRFDDALALVRTVLTVDAHSAQAYYTLGQIHLARRSQEEARKAFAEAVLNDPARVDAQIELAKIHRARREIDTAIQYAERGVKAEPDNVDAHLALVRSLAIRPDDLPKADREMTMLLSRFPGSADVQTVNGLLRLAHNDAAGARLAFERALKLEPDQLEALGGLTALDAEAHHLADARARIEARIAAARTPSPGLLLLAARVYVASRDTAGTEQVLKRLIEVDPSNLDGYNYLGQFYLSQHRLDAARAEFRTLAARQPGSVTAQTMLGLLAHAEGDVTQAQKAYEAAVQADPRAGAAANNLAWIYANGGGNLDSALQLAQSARNQLPDSLEVADTLGFVYYKKEMGGFAIPLLLQCVEKEPRNPLYQYHLGLVYAQNGEDRKARTHLERALDLKIPFEGSADARRVLSRLVY